MTKKTGRLYFLDLFRILIITLVLIFHLRGHFHISFGSKTVDQFFGNGAYGMMMFFMLSGFLLRFLYPTLIFSSGNIKEFYKKRLLKLYPLYIVYVLFSLVIRVIQHRTPDFIIILMNIIPLQAFFPSTFMEWINGGVWFVSEIFLMYLCFPIMAEIANKISINKILLILGISLFIFYFCIVNAYYPDKSLFYLYTNPVIRLMEFFCGMLTADIFNQKKPPNQSHTYKSTICVILFFALFFILAIITGKLSVRRFLNDIYWGQGFIRKDLFWIPFTSALLFLAANVKNGFWYNICRSKTVTLLSNAGYAFFLAQPYLLVCVFPHWKSLPVYKFVLSCLAANWFIAIVLYLIIQKGLLISLPKYLLQKMKSRS